MHHGPLIPAEAGTQFFGDLAVRGPESMGDAAGAVLASAVASARMNRGRHV